MSRGPCLSRRACAGMLGAVLLGLTSAAPAQVASSEISAEINAELSGAKLSGQGKLTFFGIHVYDARLWVQDGFKATDYARLPLALELEYARALNGKSIAERSLDEMKRSADINDTKAKEWLAQMKTLFTDVNKGDRITGVQVPGAATRIFINGKLRGEIRDAEFTRLFFGIWLSPRTSEPKLREALLGPARAAQ